MGCFCFRQDPSWVCYTAASKGHLHCLKKAHEAGLPWTKLVCNIAAEKGNLTCLEYAHQQGCLLGDTTVQNAAIYGHLKCLHFAVEHKCNVDEEIFHCTIVNNHSKCLRYLCLNASHPPSSNMRMHVKTAAVLGRLACLRLLHRYGWPIDSSTLWDSCDDFACLTYVWRVIDQQYWGGYPTFLESAAAGGDDDCVIWAVQHGCYQPYTDRQWKNAMTPRIHAIAEFISNRAVRCIQRVWLQRFYSPTVYLASRAACRVVQKRWGSTSQPRCSKKIACTL